MLDLLFDQVLTEEHLSQQRMEIAKHLDAERPAFQAKVKMLEGQLDDIDHAIGKLLDAIEHAANTRSLAERLIVRDIERERIMAEMAQAHAQLEPSTSELPDVAQMRCTLRAAIETGDPKRARQLLYTIIAGIEVDANSAKVKYRIPF